MKENLPKYEKVLDHGFVGLIDIMGDDNAIAQAARVSYGKGTRKTSELKGLINYLLKHHHTTPFEHVEFKFHAKMPIFVARQWVRHRTANINEYSARYSILDPEYYIPKQENMSAQSNINNQGREEKGVDDFLYSEYSATIKALCDNAYKVYSYLLNDKDWPRHKSERAGLSRELARMVLPVNFYTQWYWKIDLHNLFHFLKLRMDPHAQYEIRVYANQMYELIKPHVPLACEAFEKYTLNTETFSEIEMNTLKEMIYDYVDNKDISVEELAKELQTNLSKRELREFCDKFK